MKNSRRQWLQNGVVATAAVGMVACGGSSAATTPTKAAFVLVHGAWHGAWTYEKLIPELAKLGHVAVARDQPGHGINAQFSTSYLNRPASPAAFSAAFATESSPLATLTLENYADSVIATIDAVRALGYDKVVLVGHSLGGLTVTRVVEKAPEKVARAVYLTAHMLPPGKSTGDYSDPDSVAVTCIVSDPAATGAVRIDFNSTDAAYKARCKLAFYADIPDTQFTALGNLLTPDEPAAPFGTPMGATTAAIAARTAVPRYYIKCQQDRAIPVAQQQKFIDDTDAALPDSKTTVNSMDTSHSPFMSQPTALAALLSSIASAA